MSYWTMNRLTVRGTQAELEDFKRLAASEKTCFDFEQFIPPPKYLREFDITKSASLDESGGGLSLPYRVSWVRRNWGTTWVPSVKLVSDKCSEGSLVYEFSAKDRAPTAALSEIAMQLGSLEFILYCQGEDGYWALMYWKDLYSFVDEVGFSDFSSHDWSEKTGCLQEHVVKAKLVALENRFAEKIQLLKATLAAIKSPTQRTTLKELIGTLEGSAEVKDYIYEVVRPHHCSDDVIPESGYKQESASSIKSKSGKT